ncbi:hypothetical protein [Streptomyces radiopugnans]|uniref:hypothetical protein n=1 Tax=Streptomyces radiopugnans TaxID=403935 RepID=UPI003F1C477D
MSAELEGVIGDLRLLITQESEWSMMNSIPSPKQPTEHSTSIPQSYRDFLRVADGASCGDVTLFPIDLVEEMQFYCDPVEGSCVELGRETWFCCGVVNDEPLFIHRETGAVWRFGDTGVQWWMSQVFEEVAPDFEGFFLEHVAGPGYVSLTSEAREQQWFQVLRRAGRA